MPPQIVHPNLPPDDLHPAVDAFIERLRAHYPDMSGFTAISMTGRGRDFLHHLVHTRIGGLLPTILSFDDYRTRRIAETTGRMALPEDEAFLRFHALRCREEGRRLPSISLPQRSCGSTGGEAHRSRWWGWATRPASLMDAPSSCR